MLFFFAYQDLKKVQKFKCGLSRNQRGEFEKSPFSAVLLISEIIGKFEKSRRKNFPDTPISNSVQKVLQLLGPAGVAELAEGFGFDLADALAGDVELLAHLFQGAGAAVLDAEAEL